MDSCHGDQAACAWADNLYIYHNSASVPRNEILTFLQPWRLPQYLQQRISYTFVFVTLFFVMSRDSCDIALGYGLEDRGFESRQPLGIFLLTTVSRPALAPTQPPIQWVPGALSLGIKWSGREADHSPPSNAEVKNAWSYTSTPPIHLNGVVLS
jgi:hypothetical protein